MKRKNCMKRKYMFMALLCYALTTAAQDASHNYAVSYTHLTLPTKLEV